MSVVSCIYQLLYISHKIYDCSPPVAKRRTSFNVAKGFDRV